MPPAEKRSFNFSFSVVICVSVKMEVNIDDNLEVPKLFKISGWKIKAKTAANKIPALKAINGFVFKRIKPITANGTKNNQCVILKVVLMVSNKLLTSERPVVVIVKLKIPKTISVIIIVGTVVIVIYFICVNKSVPAIAGARFVVSLSGDILSPK